MGFVHIESALFPVSHLYKNIIRNNDKIFTPPIPHNVFGSCCHDLGHGANIRMQGHGEKMIAEHCRIRQHMKKVLMDERVQNMRIFDTLGSLTHSTNTSEQLHVLRNLTSTDHVHLTDDGYKAMASGLLKEATSLRAPREKGLNKGLTRQPTVTWNGFSSHSGIGKTSLKVVRKQANPRHTPYKKKIIFPSSSYMFF
jgi:hypothetical protein